MTAGVCPAVFLRRQDPLLRPRARSLVFLCRFFLRERHRASWARMPNERFSAYKKNRYIVHQISRRNPSRHDFDETMYRLWFSDGEMVQAHRAFIRSG